MNSHDGNSHMLSTTPLRLYLEESLLLSLPALQVAPGEVLTLMGPSGCGKSSLLAGLAGVLPSALTGSGPIRLEGEVRLGERPLNTLPAQARRIGMLFQDDLLFDHLTVAENLMFGMPATIKGKRARREKALAALARIALADQADKLPQLLSGVSGRGSACCGRCWPNPTPCCWTSPSPASTSRCGPPFASWCSRRSKRWPSPLFW